MAANSTVAPDKDNAANQQVPAVEDEWKIESLDAYDPPSSAVVWIAWLFGQIVVSCLLLMLSGFHFGLVKPDLCDKVTAVSSNTGNSTTGSPTCAFSASVLALAIVSCIVSVIDAARALPYLKSILKPEKSQDQITNVEAERLRGCFSSNKYLSFNIVRVCYCWILVHSILITVAANTYEWSWETDELSVLANTATFFLTCTVYILIIFAVVTWLIGCYFSEKTRQKDQQRPGEDDNKIMKRLFVTTMLTVGLVVSNALCMVSTLVLFFYPKPGSSDRIVGLIVVMVYVVITSIAWLIILSILYNISVVVDNFFKFLVINIFAFFVVVPVLIACLVPLINLLICPQCDASLWLLLFLIHLIFWIILLCICLVWIRKVNHEQTDHEQTDREQTDREQTDREQTDHERVGYDPLP